MSEINVTITRRNINKIVNYAQAAYDEHKCEIGGMAVCIKTEDNDWKIENPVILKQDITGTNCSLDQTELAKYYVDTNANKRYRNKDYRFLWWHSHHMMDSFWSGTDLNAIDEFSDGDLSFALVVNLKGKYLVRASAWLLGMHQDMELDVLESDTKASQKVIDEVNEKCQTKTYTKSNWSSKTYIPGHTNEKQMTVMELANTVKPKIENEEEEAFSNKWVSVYEAVEENVTDTLRGDKDIKGMKEEFALINGILSKEKFPIRIDYSNLNTLNDLMQLEPAMIIETGDEKFEEIVTNLITEQMDYHSYNWSYGLGRRLY